MSRQNSATKARAGGAKAQSVIVLDDSDGSTPASPIATSKSPVRVQRNANSKSGGGAAAEDDDSASGGIGEKRPAAKKGKEKEAHKKRSAPKKATSEYLVDEGIDRVSLI